MKLQGKLEEARRHVMAAVELDSSTAEYQRDLGLILMQQGRLEESEASLSRALALDPDLAETYLYLGIASYRLQKLSEAVRHLLKAVEFESTLQREDVARAYHTLGTAFGRLGRLHNLHPPLLSGAACIVGVATSS